MAEKTIRVCDVDGVPAVVRGAIEACRLEAREPAGVRLGGSGDAVRAEKVAIRLEPEPARSWSRFRVYSDAEHSRAEDGTRTRDPNLGKVVLYQLSHFRIHSKELRTSEL